MFNNIAKYYDLLNRVLSLGIDKLWRKRMIKEIGKRNPKLILDVATGTADVAIATARKLEPQHVTGVDISTEMLAVGRQKVAKKGLTDVIRLDEGDSENLLYETDTYDAITVAFGVRNYENLHKGMKEMRRVLRPGGQLAVLEFSRPTLFPFKQLFNGYFKYILPQIGRLTSGDSRAYSYLYESVQAFPDGERFLEVMRQTGYNNCKCIPLTLGICSLYLGDKAS